MRTLLVAMFLLYCLTGISLAQPVSDSGKTFTIIPPKGWNSAPHEDGVVLEGPNEVGSVAIIPRDKIPLDDASVGQVETSITGDGLKTTDRKRTTVGGVPAVRIAVDGVSGEYQGTKGFYYLISNDKKGWIIFCLAPTGSVSKSFPLMEQAVGSMRFSK